MGTTKREKRAAAREQRLQQRRGEFERSPLGQECAARRAEHQREQQQVQQPTPPVTPQPRAVDARSLTDGDFRRLCALRGLDLGNVAPQSPQLPPTDRAVRASRRQVDRLQRSLTEQQQADAQLWADAVARSALDGRTAPASKIRDRLRALLGDEGQIGSGLRDLPPPRPKVIDRRFLTPEQVQHIAAERQRRARRSLDKKLAQVPAGGALDSRTLSDEEYAELRRLRGLG